VSEAAVQERIREFLEMLRAWPAPTQFVAAHVGVYLSHANSHDDSTLEGDINHLRLQLKYIMFDLEATHRENKYLRQMLDARRNRPPHRDDDDALL
jgi:hypothetical protein